MAVDWSRIYGEFIGGSSFAELARQYGISYSAIYRRAKRDAWAKERERVRGDMAEAVSDRLSGSAADSAALIHEAEIRALDSVSLIADKLGNRIQKTQAVTMDDVNAVARLISAIKVLHEIFTPQEREAVRIELGEGVRELGI